MHVPSYVVPVKVCGKAVPVGDMNDILMPYAPLFSVCRQSYGFVCDSGSVYPRYLSASCILLFQMVELHVKDRCLDGIQSAVVSAIDIVVACVASIIGQGAHGCGELRVGSGYGSRISYGSDVFRRVEAESCGIPESTGHVAA